MATHELRSKLWKRLGLEDHDIDRLVTLWMIFGNNGSKHAAAHHTIIQGIIEHGRNNFLMWKSGCTSEFIHLIESEFPSIASPDEQTRECFFCGDIIREKDATRRAKRWMCEECKRSLK